jgi:hypothetical protein
MLTSILILYTSDRQPLIEPIVRFGSRDHPQWMKGDRKVFPYNNQITLNQSEIILQM